LEDRLRAVCPGPPATLHHPPRGEPGQESRGARTGPLDVHPLEAANLPPVREEGGREDRQTDGARPRRLHLPRKPGPGNQPILIGPGAAIPAMTVGGQIRGGRGSCREEAAVSSCIAVLGKPPRQLPDSGKDRGTPSSARSYPGGWAMVGLDRAD